MKLKPAVLTVAFVIFMGTCACLLSNPANANTRSSLNAKFEYPSNPHPPKEAAAPSNPVNARTAITFPNAKREDVAKHTPMLSHIRD